MMVTNMKSNSELYGAIVDCLQTAHTQLLVADTFETNTAIEDDGRDGYAQGTFAHDLSNTLEQFIHLSVKANALYLRSKEIEAEENGVISED